ncbi:hypothetical protein P20652_0339 [Pseudoalteromonas sp. BSi20652]|nr:hypothetical protein P20652_0339 [Pseudoalteromonas sp. BSi20652]
MFITSSSNHYGAIGFWHALNTKGSVLENYRHFANYFSDNLFQLPDTSLAILARNKIPSAQYAYSIRLLNNNESDTAKQFWLAGINQLNVFERKELSAQLLTQLRWDDLKLLANINKLPKGDAFNHLQLYLSTPKNKIPSDFIEDLGFSFSNSIGAPKKQCMFNVIVMSDHRNGLYKLDKFINKYNQQPEPRKNIFCFSKPVYVAGELNCKSNSSNTAHCDWQSSKLKQKLPNNYDFLVMMPKHGTANVSNGKMLINSKASYSIFLHELMHFNGFEDEYALPISKQSWLCLQHGFVAPNLFISHGENAPVGWHKANSCQQGGIAYKPSKGWSIMQYQQVGLSAQYRALWLRHLDMTNGNFISDSSRLTLASKAILN